MEARAGAPRCATGLRTRTGAVLRAGIDRARPGILPTLRRRSTRDGSHRPRPTGDRAYAYRSERSLGRLDAHRLRRSRQRRAWRGFAADLGGLRAPAMPVRSRDDRVRHANATQARRIVGAGAGVSHRVPPPPGPALIDGAFSLRRSPRRGFQGHDRSGTRDPPRRQ